MEALGQLEGSASKLRPVVTTGRMDPTKDYGHRLTSPLALGRIPRGTPERHDLSRMPPGGLQPEGLGLEAPTGRYQGRMLDDKVPLPAGLFVSQGSTWNPGQDPTRVGGGEAEN